MRLASGVVALVILLGAPIVVVGRPTYCHGEDTSTVATTTQAPIPSPSALRALSASSGSGEDWRLHAPSTSKPTPDAGETIDASSAPSARVPSPSSSFSPTPRPAVAKDEPSTSTNVVVIIIPIVLVVLVVIAGIVFFRRRKQGRDEDVIDDHHPRNKTLGTDDAVIDVDGAADFRRMGGPGSQDGGRTTSNTASSGSRGKPTESHLNRHEHDPELAAVRVPLEKIHLGPLLSRGGYGEVYRGTFQNRDVAIKRLLPDRRRDMRQIEAFFAEVKLMASMEHERIVRFIGVAWDAFSDLCVISEFMAGGDLRALLVRYREHEECHPRGFDAEKVRIALHVAHALTYMHSLQPIVLHRDLKSKNILLDERLNAKLTDFGVSRERVDCTMTAGVGSSLWMAPEVMLGERYDEKADIFSFGVVLSELDTHAYPYAHAREPGSDRKLPETAILQMVALGRVQVAFSPEAEADTGLGAEMVRLARACVALEPRDRPGAPEVLHRVHLVWRQCSIAVDGEQC